MTDAMLKALRSGDPRLFNAEMRKIERQCKNRVAIDRHVSFAEAEALAPGCVERASQLASELSAAMGAVFEVRTAFIVSRKGQKEIGFCAIDALDEQEGNLPAQMLFLGSDAIPEIPEGRFH